MAQALRMQQAVRDLMGVWNEAEDIARTQSNPDDTAEQVYQRTRKLMDGWLDGISAAKSGNTSQRIQKTRGLPGFSITPEVV